MSEQKVFVVDDSSTLRALVVQWVRQAGFTAIECSDGKECLDALGKHEPVMILMDLEMPHLRGDECCRKIKASPDKRDIPVIMMTTRRSPVDVQSFWEAKADDFLSKPIVKSQFEAKVASLKAPPSTHFEKAATGRLNPAAAILSRVAQELRQSVRVPFYRAIEFRATGQEEWQSGYTTNLSSGGLCIRTLTPLQPGAEVQVRIELDKSLRTCSGMVAWNEPAGSASMGVSFTQLGWEAGLEVLKIVKGTGGIPSIQSQAGANPGAAPLR